MLRIGSRMAENAVRKERIVNMKIAYPEAGKIINIHGYRGVVKLENLCDTPKVLAGLKTVYFKEGETYRPVKVLAASVQKKFVLMTLEGVDSEEKANALRQTVVYAAREDILGDSGKNLISDLISLPVKHADTGKTLGKIRDVLESGAGLIYLIEAENGKEVMVPAVPAFTVKEDPDDALYLRPIPGMFDGEDDDAL